MTHFVEVHGQVAVFVVEVTEIDVDEGVAIGRGPVGGEKTGELLRHQRRYFEGCFHNVFFWVDFSNGPHRQPPMPGKAQTKKTLPTPLFNNGA